MAHILTAEEIRQKFAAIQKINAHDRTKEF